MSTILGRDCAACNSEGKSIAGVDTDRNGTRMLTIEKYFIRFILFLCLFKKLVDFGVHVFMNRCPINTFRIAAYKSRQLLT